MQIYPIAMRRNRHVILKHDLCTLPTQPSALLSLTMVAHMVCTCICKYINVHVRNVPCSVLRCHEEFPLNFFMLIYLYELNFPMLVQLKMKKLWPSGIRFVNIK